MNGAREKAMSVNWSALRTVLRSVFCEPEPTHAMNFVEQMDWLWKGGDQAAIDRLKEKKA